MMTPQIMTAKDIKKIISKKYKNSGVYFVGEL